MDYLIRGSVFLEKNPNFKLVGRDEDLERLSSVLMRSSSNSVILVGAGGVGVSAILHGLQALKNSPEASFDIVSKRLFWLDVDGLFSIGDSSELNKQFQKIMNRLKRTSDSILMVEDTRDFIEACRNSGSSHFINDIMSAVKNDYTQVILETRDEDLDVVLKAHSDVREHFTLLDIREPNPTALQSIIEKKANDLSMYHGIKIDSAAITTAIELTTKYRTRDQGLNRAQPERSGTLLDRAMATYRLNAHKNVSQDISTKLREFYKNQRDGEIAIVEKEEEIERVLKEMQERNTGGFSLMEPKEVVDMREKITTYQAFVDENKENFDVMTANINENLLLTKELVMKEFSNISGIPSSKLGEDEREKLKNLEISLKSRIFGQDNAVTRLANAIKAARVIKRNEDKPLASFMFIGPSGTGKTEIAKALSENLLGSDRELTRFDMAEYGQKHDVAKLVGSPPGYEGFEAGGILTNFMRTNPNRIILFDEIEKADVSIYNIFLAILADSRLTDNIGRVVSFNDAILIFTSNIGQTYFLNKELTFEEAQEEAIVELNATYRSEFLNRFDGRQNIVCFNRLGVEHIMNIVKREIIKLSKAYEDTGLMFFISPHDLENFCEEVYDPVIGARGLPGYIKANLEPILANLVLDGFAGEVYLGYDSETKTFKMKEKKSSV